MIKKSLLFAALLPAAGLHAAIRDIAWSLVESEPVYPNQQIQLMLTIEADPNEEINGFNLNPSPFNAQPIKVEMGQVLSRQRIQEEGKETIDRIRARFPAQTLAAGTIDFPATQFIGSRLVFQRDGFGFSFPREERVTADVKPFSFTVAPLPEADKPEGFSGAVGKYAFTGTTAPRTLAPGSVTTVTLKIEAKNGTLPATIVPQPEADPARFRVYPVKVIQRDARHVITETLVVPLSETSTQFTTTPFSWFDPIARRYVTTRASLPPLTIRQQAEVDLPALKMIETSPAATHQSGVGLKENTQLRFGPSERSPVLHRLSAGEQVTPLERAEGWVRVEAAGRRGWMRDFEMGEL